MSDKPDIHPRAASPRRPADRALYDDSLRCNRCGFCTSFCPTYLATGDEGLSPRGRNQAFRALLEGRLSDPAQAEGMFSSCLLCGICTSVCFSQVPTARLMSAARGKTLESRGEPLLLKFILRGLLPRPSLLEPLLKVLFWGKRLGISRFLAKTGLLARLSPALAAAEEMAEEDLPARFLRDRLPPAPPAAEAVQFLACGPNYLRPSVGGSTAALLKQAGVRCGSAGNVCCGLPGVSAGDLDAARALARKNIVRLENWPRAVILVDDSSCAAAVKEYPALFEAESEWRRRAEAVSARTRDFVEWFADRCEAEGVKREEDLRSKKPSDTKLSTMQPFLHASRSALHARKVTYHDPCKARYAQKIVDPPRRLLETLGADQRELPEADQCCGGGGTYSFLQPEISRAVLDRKVRNILSTGADVVLTSSVSCLLQLRFGLRRAGSPMEAMHLSEFVEGHK